MRALALAFGCVVACSDAPKPPASPRVEAIYGRASETALSPYPSDRYTRADPSSPTGLRVKLDATTTADGILTTTPLTVSELNETDGFSITGGIVMTLSGRIDVRGLVIDKRVDPPIVDPIRDAETYKQADSPMFLLDVDPKSPERGTLHGIVPRWWAQDVDPDFPTADYTLIAQPARPLRPRTRYLFVATGRLKDVEGRPIVPSAETARMLGKPADAYEQQVLAALAELEAKVGLARSEVALATVFTTQSVIESMVALSKQARARPPPAIVDPWTVAKPMQMPDTRVRFRATFDTPDYRDKTTHFWKLDKDGAPIEQSRVPLEVFLDFADGTKSGERPIVIFQHGLGGDKDGTWGTAQRLASLGVAVIGIDSPHHGARAPGGTTDMIVSITSFLGVDIDKRAFDIALARDNFRQTASDQLELVRFIGTLGALDLLPVGAPDGVPDLDVSRILYIGHSFGAVQGATIFALAPEITQAVWNVGGAALTVLMRDSPLFSLVLKGLRPPGTTNGAVARFFSIAQALVDPGDPVSYARYATLEALDGVAGWKPRDVLLQEVIDDGIVPNPSSDALARACGLALVDPLAPVSGLKAMPAPITGNLPSGGTGAMYAFARIHGDKAATHGELIFSPEGQKQYVEFFRSGLAGAHATVIASR